MEGKEKAFKEMVHRERDAIWRICSCYRLGAAWEVEDAFNEVLCALWKGMESYDGRSRERTWVTRVAVNTLNSLLRRRGNQPSPPVERVAERSYSDEGYADLVQLIETLQEPDYTIVMAHLSGYDYKEIAQITGLTIGAVSMRLTRAKRRLRKQYNQD